jgi:vitamin B12 transporter
MSKKITASLIALAFATPSFSAENIELGDIVVTATRTPQPREAVIADVTVIDAEEIQRGGQSTLVEVLQQQPGVEIDNSGGTGKVSSIFLRGTNSGHVVVLIDGIRIQSATVGTTTFENIPLNQVDRIEILRGPASSLYGQDAIGGVIQIFTKKGVEGFKPYASLGFGSYDTKTGEAGVRGKINDTSYALNLSASDIGGFSAAHSRDDNIDDDDAYRNLSVSLNLNHKLAEGHEIGLQFFNSDGTSRYDNFFNFSNFSSKLKLQQQTAALYAKNQWLDFWKSTLRVGFSKDKLKNYDQNFFPSFSRFDTEQTQINWQHDLNLPIGTLTLMYDRLEDEVKSTDAFTKNSRTNEGYVASYLANIGAHSLHTSLREDHNSQFGSNLTGGIGYGFNFNEQWRASASYGSAFKAPTFNDLYYPFTSFGIFGDYSGNPNLKPEKSDNIEASIKFQDNQTNASVTVYQNKVRDLIASNGLAFGGTQINLRKVTIEGLTFAASQRWDNLELNGSADIQSPRDDKTDNLLVRRANRHGKLGVAYTWQDWRWGAEVVASSARYNDPANEFRLGGYALVNLTGQYKINADWNILARVNNVLDKDYVLSSIKSSFGPTDPDYNTPGANLFVNIRYEPQ